MVFKMDQDMIKKDNKIMKIFESKITIKQGWKAANYWNTSNKVPKGCINHCRGS
jgi:hypothetical protein